MSIIIPVIRLTVVSINGRGDGKFSHVQRETDFFTIIPPVADLQHCHHDVLP